MSPRARVPQGRSEITVEDTEVAYVEARAGEQREPCTSCNTSDYACTKKILNGGKACCDQCALTDTHPKPDHDGKQYMTQATIHFTPSDARKLAIELLSAAEKCNRPDQYVKLHSFGKAASAWEVSNFIIAEM